MNKKNLKKTKGYITIIIVMVIPLFIATINNYSNFGSIFDEPVLIEPSPKTSLPLENSEWWNVSWDFRIPLSLTMVGDQQNAPIELFINFTKYFKDLNVDNSLLNTSSIRVVEYLSSANYYEVESQFDKYNTYNNRTNAIGDIIWILNGTTSHADSRDFFIYFNNGTKANVVDPNYDPIRIWHEGFEDFQVSDLLRPTDGQDNSHPNSWEISNTTKARGNSALKIWGNCWKASATGTISINSDTRITAKMRFDDPSIFREISGIGFRTGYTSIPDPQNSYNIRGNQVWGSAGSYKFRNQYYAADTFFWYTFDLDTETSLSSFNHIFYEADDDAYTNLNLFWDDISIWSKPVQTTPNNTIVSSFGDVQPIAFTLKIICKDEQGNLISNAEIFLSNNLEPSMNQDDLTDANGQWIFTDIKFNGMYNITVNYTQQGVQNPLTRTIYYYENYPITFLKQELVAHTYLTTIDFSVTDKDLNPIRNGYVVLKDGGSNDVSMGVLDASGETTLRWINDTDYDYNVYFDYDSLIDQSSYWQDSVEIASGTVFSGTHDVNIATEIVELNFNVTDNTPEKVPFANAKLRIYNETNYGNPSNTIANITVLPDGSAQFISFSNETSGNWGNYTLEIYFGGELRNFIADSEPISLNYNFTLYTQKTVSIEINLNMNIYNTTLNFIDISSDNYWGSEVSIEFNFTSQDPDFPNPTLVTPDELYIQILDDEQDPFSNIVSFISSEDSTGVFNATFNTKLFQLIGGTRYWIKITANYKNYILPEPLLKRFEVKALPTGLTIHNYSLNLLIDNEISEYYNENVNMSVNYYNALTYISLSGATLTYEWNYGIGNINPDPIHMGYYYFELDTHLAPNIGKYRIEITAMLENYTSYYQLMDINILSRQTTINQTSTLYQLSPEIYVLQSLNFSFEYEDTLTGLILDGLNVKSYNWYKLDDQGNPLSGPGNEGTGILEEDINKRYILDFDTETRETGDYTIFITLQKNNYELRNAFISLSIRYRPITVSFSATGLTGRELNIVKGTPINFKIVLTDPTNNSALLTGATVKLYVNNIEYDFTEISQGTYSVDFSTLNFDAFFMPNTISECYIEIEKVNYEADPITFVIIIGMEEIFPGFPMFYFLIIVIGILAIAGSLVAYRTIQQAKIPKFVKKARAMKKEIKGRKSISESLLYPSKEEYIVKKLGDKWDMLGLSLETILGLEDKKRKMLPESTEPKGGAE